MNAVLLGRSGERIDIALNRPKRHNAINKNLLNALEAALETATRDPGVQLIVIKGSGESFCSGDDLDEHAAGLPGDGEAARFIEQIQNLTRLIMLNDKTIVCAVRGWAIGAGASWPLNADFALWSDSARMRFPEAGHGLFCSGGVSLLLERCAGAQRAAEILRLGPTLNADALVAAGIAAEITRDSAMDAQIDKLSDRLLSLPAGSLRRCKLARIAIIKDALETALAIETTMMLDSLRALRLTGAAPKIKRS
ncbi:MAG: enoyl-CoA hydratase/isomerase family protein [Parvularculaceae bacterium]|nr:enoyl-CoA hydratase/isomerase family protein [Parvularculaceae bacterium]